MVWPEAPVLRVFSEPARSTRVSLLFLTVSVAVFFWVSVKMKTEWERDEVLFILVAAIARCICPVCISTSTSSMLCTY
jgi:hypothetical protein